jgi:tRNA dimethylallyltransferase
MVEPGIGCGGHRRLGAEGCAQTRLAEHGEVVGAVADSHGLLRRQLEAGAQFDERIELGLLAENGIGDRAVQDAVAGKQRIRAVLVEADGLADRPGEDGEAARDEGGIAAIRAHGPDELAPARRQRDAVADDLADDRERHAFQQGDALAQGRFELDLAAHRPLGDGGNMLLEADESGELVDAFLADHGRIHVGEEQRLAARRRRLDDDVDRGAFERGPDIGFELARVGGFREEVGSDRAVERGRSGGAGHGAGEAGEQSVVDERLTVGGYECGDEHVRNRVKAAGEFGAVLIAGPTASGKSALAIEIARRIGGTVVNADSMQVYADLRVLSARPSEAEEAMVPHRLYGHIDGAVNYSAMRYVADVTALLAELRERGSLPILVGGTGLYFKAVTEGFSAMPPVPEEVRATFRAHAEGRETSALHDELARCDPAMAERLRPSDRMRIMRALEVFRATGRSLASFQGEREPGPLGQEPTLRLFVHPDREAVRERIDRRFEAMMAEGALDEVAQLKRRGLDPLLPIMRAHGVPGLIAHLDGRISLEEAIRRGQADTRAYAKRQVTWFRHQMEGWEAVAPEAALELAVRRLGC